MIRPPTLPCSASKPRSTRCSRSSWAIPAGFASASDALAIGNPFGLERTFTTGVISSLNRTLPSRTQRPMKSIIQVDAAINPGSSGGPLLDSHGRLIGMNTAIASKTGQSAGVGFAIPVGTISRIVPQLIANGRVIRPEIGIARVLESDHGLVIVAVTPGGPAERAGLKGFRVVRERRQLGPFVEEHRRVDRSSADTIMAVDGEKVTSAEQFLLLIEAHRPGEEVELSVIRDGRLESHARPPHRRRICSYSSGKQEDRKGKAS